MTCWVTFGDTLGNAQPLVDMLGDSVPEMEELSVGNTWGCAEALSDSWADNVAELQTVTPGDRLGDAHALNYRLVDSWRHTGQCGGTSLRLGSRGSIVGGGDTCDTLGDARALVDTLADTVQEMEEYLVVDKRVGTQALMDAMAKTLAEVEAVTPGDKLGDAHALNYLVADT